MDPEALSRRLSIKSKFKSKKSSRKKQVSSSCACFIVTFVIVSINKVINYSLDNFSDIRSLFDACHNLHGWLCLLSPFANAWAVCVGYLQDVFAVVV